MRGTVVSVRKDEAGSYLAAALTSGDGQVQVASARSFEKSGSVVISGNSIAYTRIRWADVENLPYDTLVLASTSPVTASARVTRVSVPGPVEFVAQVRPDGGQAAEDAVIVHHLIDDEALAVGQYVNGARVECETARGRLWLTKILDREPRRNLGFASPGSLPPGAIDMDDPAWASLISTLAGGVGSEHGGGHYGDPYGSGESGGGHYGDPHG